MGEVVGREEFQAGEAVSWRKTGKKKYQAQFPGPCSLPLLLHLTPRVGPLGGCECGVRTDDALTCSGVDKWQESSCLSVKQAVMALNAFCFFHKTQCIGQPVLGEMTLKKWVCKLPH